MQKTFLGFVKFVRVIQTTRIYYKVFFGQKYSTILMRFSALLLELSRQNYKSRLDTDGWECIRKQLPTLKL